MSNNTGALKSVRMKIKYTSGKTAIPANDQFDFPYRAWPINPDHVPFSSGLPQAPSGGLTML